MSNDFDYDRLLAVFDLFTSEFVEILDEKLFFIFYYLVIGHYGHVTIGQKYEEI